MCKKTAFLVLIALVIITNFGCQKDNEDYRCNTLKMAMKGDDVSKVINLVTDMINGLPSSNYTEQNANGLVATLSNQCGITTEMLCFSCIQTFPEQTEIKLSFTYSGATVNKILDISYKKADNKMIVVGMHN